MNAYEFMASSPWLTFFLALIAARTAMFIWNRFWRHFNIRKHGYPPPHCDADGDFPEREEVES